MITLEYAKLVRDLVAEKKALKKKREEEAKADLKAQQAPQEAQAQEQSPSAAAAAQAVQLNINSESSTPNLISATPSPQGSSISSFVLDSVAELEESEKNKPPFKNLREFLRHLKEDSSPEKYKERKALLEKELQLKKDQLKKYNLEIKGLIVEIEVLKIKLKEPKQHANDERNQEVLEKIERRRKTCESDLESRREDIKKCEKDIIDQMSVLIQAEARLKIVAKDFPEVVKIISELEKEPDSLLDDKKIFPNLFSELNAREADLNHALSKAMAEAEWSPP